MFEEYASSIAFQLSQKDLHIDHLASRGADCQQRLSAAEAAVVELQGLRQRCRKLEDELAKRRSGPDTNLQHPVPSMLQSPAQTLSSSLSSTSAFRIPQSPSHFRQTAAAQRQIAAPSSSIPSSPYAVPKSRGIPRPGTSQYFQAPPVPPLRPYSQSRVNANPPLRTPQQTPTFTHQQAPLKAWRSRFINTSNRK